MDFEKACAFARQWSARVDRQTRAAQAARPSPQEAAIYAGSEGRAPTPRDANADRRKPPRA